MIPPSPSTATDIAGTVRATSSPISAPRAIPSRAYATGTVPSATYSRVSNQCGARYSGIHDATHARAAVSGGTNSRTSTTAGSSFEASQRVGPTDWVQASLYVPDSSSRATTGPARNAPSTPGSSWRTRLPYRVSCPTPNMASLKSRAD